MSDFWTWYNKNGIIPNLWKGFMGIKDNERMQDELYEKENAWQREQFATQMDFANRQLQENVRASDENLAMQKEAFNYQKQLNATQMEREDSAMRRQMADLQAAGLSPLAAVGGSGASSAALSSGPAPQRDMSGINAAAGQYQDIARQYAALHLQASQNYSNRKSQYAQQVNSEILGARMALKQMKSDMVYKGLNLAEQHFNAKVNNRYTEEQTKRLQYENNWYEEHGYQHITLATVFSDFLNKGKTKEAIDKFSDLVSQGLNALADSATKVADAIKSHSSRPILLSVSENKDIAHDLNDEDFGFVLNYAKKINKPYTEWDLSDWLSCAEAQRKSRK